MRTSHNDSPTCPLPGPPTSASGRRHGSLVDSYRFVATHQQKQAATRAYRNPASRLDCQRYSLRLLDSPYSIVPCLLPLTTNGPPLVRPFVPDQHRIPVSDYQRHLLKFSAKLHPRVWRQSFGDEIFQHLLEPRGCRNHPSFRSVLCARFLSQVNSPDCFFVNLSFYSLHASSPVR